MSPIREYLPYLAASSVDGRCQAGSVCSAVLICLLPRLATQKACDFNDPTILVAFEKERQGIPAVEKYARILDSYALSYSLYGYEFSIEFEGIKK